MLSSSGLTITSRDSETEVAVNLAKAWKNAAYSPKKEVAMIMINKTIISENGDTEIIWNI